MSDRDDTARRARAPFPGWPLSGTPEEHRDEITGNYSVFKDEPLLQAALTQINERQQQHRVEIDALSARADADEKSWRERTHGLSGHIASLASVVEAHRAEDDGRHELVHERFTGLGARLDRGETADTNAKSSKVVIWAALIGAFVVLLVAIAAAWSALDGRVTTNEAGARSLQMQLDQQRADTNAKLDRIDDRLQAIGDRVGARPLAPAAPAITAPNP